MSNLAILADSKAQNDSLFPVLAMFRYDCPLTVKLASTQWNLVKKTWRDSAPIDMFLSSVSVLVVVQLSFEVPEGLMNNPVYIYFFLLSKESVIRSLGLFPHQGVLVPPSFTWPTFVLCLISDIIVAISNVPTPDVESAQSLLNA
jgi:hypothetical protein